MVLHDNVYNAESARSADVYLFDLPSDTCLLVRTRHRDYRICVTSPKEGLVEIVEGNPQVLPAGTLCKYFGATPSWLAKELHGGWIKKGLCLCFGEFADNPEKLPVVTSVVREISLQRAPSSSIA